LACSNLESGPIQSPERQCTSTAFAPADGDRRGIGTVMTAPLDDEAVRIDDRSAPFRPGDGARL
jgi:hypothetical protein